MAIITVNLFRQSKHALELKFWFLYILNGKNFGSHSLTACLTTVDLSTGFMAPFFPRTQFIAIYPHEPLFLWLLLLYPVS